MKSKTVTLKNFYDIKITHIKGIITPEFFGTAAHTHDHCEIFVHLKGELDILVNESFYHVSEKCIRMYNSEELHYGKSSFPQDMEWYQISFPQHFLKQENYKSILPVLYGRKPGEKNVFFTSEFGAITKLLSDSFEYFITNNPLWELYFQSNIIKLMCILNENKYNSFLITSENLILNEIINVIYNDFRHISSVQDLGNIISYSTSYIYRLFKEHMDITPYRFICDKKLNEAKIMLKNGFTIAQACDYAGFNDYTNFITLFKKSFGITPKKYQSEHKNKNRPIS